MLYAIIIKDALVIEVTETELHYIQKKKLKGIYPFDTYDFGYRSVRSGSTTETIDLQVVNRETNEEVLLNCESLGPNQFNKMFAIIEANKT